MNYRHIFHAGNFADVFKHAALALCLRHLALKPAAFRVIDTHAGVGGYDLAGVEAGKTLESHDGIGRLIGVDAAPIPAREAALLAPYLDIVRAANPDNRLSYYPGSPDIARAMLRGGDRLVVNELHSDDHAALAARYAGDERVKAMNIDAWIALRALLPPPERRGLILIDPPFEDRGDFANLSRALVDAQKRFATGVFILWHPIKDEAAVRAFYEEAADARLEKILRTRLYIRTPTDAPRLDGCGLFIVNPPWTLKADLEILGPFLAERLAQGAGAHFALDDLAR